MIKNYYYILGLEKNASNEEIKKAYRKLAIKFHPDNNQGDKYFEARFRDIHEAYETLIDKTKRQKYDIKISQNLTNNKSHKNYLPIIEYFEVFPNKVQYGEKVIVKWKCLNADIIEIKPFGITESHEGQRAFCLYNFEDKLIEIKLIAINSNIKREISESKNLINKTYIKLKNKFVKEFLAEEKAKIERTKKLEEEQRRKFEELYEVRKINLIDGRIMTIIISAQSGNTQEIKIGNETANNGIYRLNNNLKAYKIRNNKIIEEYILSTEKQKNGKLLTVGKNVKNNQIKGSPVWLDDEIAPNGIYKYGFWGKINVANGVVQK